MSTIPEITEAAIEAQVGERSFRLGAEYAHDGAVFEARRQGMTLKARCQGSQPDAYRVEVTFDAQGIADAACSCPVGGGGHCKHVAALLLAWNDKPETFVELEEDEAALERRSKAELIALVRHMLRQQPDLEWLLATPLPEGEPGAAGMGAADTTPAWGGRGAPGPVAKPAPVDRALYRRQADAAFRHGGYEHGAAAGIAGELLALKEIADGFLQQQDHANAAAVYAALSESVAEHDEVVEDEEGDLIGVVQECVNGLSTCLQADPGADSDAAVREVALQALFAVYRADVQQGGISLADAVPAILKGHTTAEERRTVAGWVRGALPRNLLGQQSDQSFDHWQNEAWGALLLTLEGDTLDDESFLRICRETGRRRDLVDRLLALGRVDEATAELERAATNHLLTLAGVFEQHGHGDVPERPLRERVSGIQDHTAVPILEWLKQRSAARGDQAAVQDLAERVFRLYPTLERYQELRRLATELGRWQTLRPKLTMLLDTPAFTELLIRVYLDEREIDQALAALAAKPDAPRTFLSNGGFLPGYNIGLEVARAAEAPRPQAALDIYRKYVDRLIDQRGRDSYRAACGLLQRVRAIHEQLGEREVWASYIAALRDRTRALRALRDELAAAGL